LPEDEQISHWTPYQLRHAAATAMEDESGLDESQVLLDSSSSVEHQFNDVKQDIERLKEAPGRLR
jgi:integrase